MRELIARDASRYGVSRGTLYAGLKRGVKLL